MTTTKTCTSCKETRSVEEFNKNKSTKDGLHTQCKICLKDYRKRSKDKRKSWLEANDDHVKSYSAEYREKNRDSLREYDRKRTNENIDSERERWRAYYHNNKESILLKKRNSRRENPDHHRSLRLRWTYNISLDEYNQMVEDQDHRCAICHELVELLFVDHDHKCCAGQTSCGKCVRSLLCQACNAGIGFLKDDPEILQKASEYVEFHRGPTISN